MRGGRRLLEEIPAERVDIGESVSAEVRREMEAFGVRVGSIAIKDIILPGDIHEFLNQISQASFRKMPGLRRTSNPDLLRRAEPQPQGSGVR